MDDGEKHDKLHIVMLPWLAHGHIAPFLEFSKRLAERGHHISFVSTPRNIERLPKVPQHLAPKIDLVKLSFPPGRDIEGLPMGAESMSEISSSKLPHLIRAYEGLQEPMVEFLEAYPPDWIIYDPFAYFLPPILAATSKKLGRSILQATFIVVSANSTCFLEPPTSKNTINGLNHIHIEPRDIAGYLIPPKWIPFPNKLAYRPFEILRVIDQLSGCDDQVGAELGEALLSSIKASDVILLQSCMELEGDYLNLLEEMHGKPVLATGFLTPSLQEMASRDDHDHKGWQVIKEWLDQHDKASVVYIALGSEATLSQQLLDELALGIEQSDLPFFWALRKPKGDEESLELPDGFEDRTRERGLVWKGWAPQLMILDHDSVGGFLVHCGWNSTIEGLQFGLPLIMLPLYGEQGITARFLVDKGVGIEIPRDEQDGTFTRNSVAESLKLVVVEEAGKVYRDNAKKMQIVLGERSLHSQYIDKLEEFICNR
ncbi:hypothetical protein Droror1_Dr00019197 [Drosera rotundifolia]